MLRDLKVPFFTILFLFLGFFLFTKLFGLLSFPVNSITTTKQNLFSVDGTGDATAVPDTALLTFAVTKQATTVEAAQNEVNQIINKINADLKTLGVDPKNIKTTNYSVNPNYDYSGGKQSTNGYSVDANLEVKIKPLEKANQAIDIATKDGTNQVGGIQFTLDDTEQKKLENQARVEAINEAKTKAQSLANAADIHLGRIVDVQERGNTPQPIFKTMAADAGKANDATTPPTELNPGENKVSITVTLSYETY